MFLLGISLVFGIVIANQVIAREKDLTQAHIDKSKKINEIDTMDDLNSLPQFSLGKRNINILLVGEDRRSSEKTISNTDTLLVANINAETGKVSILSIPRDTQVIIPGHGMSKINAAARLGNGLNLTIKLVEELTGLAIDGYVLTNFESFKSIIDTLGGITVTIEKDMYYATGDSKDGVINLKKGTQRLNGSQALQYARFRHDALGDISRTTRQQAIIKAAGIEFMQVKTIAKLPWLIPKITNALETNLTVEQIWSLANVLRRSNNLEISNQTLPGYFFMANNISYWKVNNSISHEIVKNFIEEGKNAEVFISGEKGIMP